MKNLIMLSVVVLLLFSLVGCGNCKHEYDEGLITKEATCTETGEKTFTCLLCKKTKTEIVEKKEHTYKEVVTKEPTYKDKGEKTFTCDVCGNSYKESIPVRDEEVIVTVTDKTNVPKDVSSGRYSDRVEFTFNVENKTNKVVKGIQGKLTIYDLFEKEILKFNCDFTGNKISPNDFITVSDLGIDINQFMDTHLKIYNTDFTDLKFKYEVISVVYDDSDTSDSSAVEAIKNQNVTVIVTDKSNLETNYNVGRYSPRVEFSFEVHNNTSKDIKGVQGVLTIKDLFGVDILSVNLDFTGQTISANDSIDVTGMGIDINQFIDEHVKVYNTNLDDMNYEYQVSAIVYSDGTMEQF